MAFSWPAVTADPHDVPVAIAGPVEQAKVVGAGLAQGSAGAVALTPVPDREAAIVAIERREVYGAIIVGAAPEVLTSSAASPAVAQMLTGLGAALEAQAGAAGAPISKVTITDVVPLLASDSRGAGMAAAAIPLVLGGLLGGVALTLVVAGVWRRIAALGVYSVCAGFAITGILQGWFGVLGGSFISNVGAFAVCLLAISATSAGLGSVFGHRGIPFGALIFLLFANPIAGVAMPKEFLVGSWGDVGQWFPPGAAATLIRNLTYFPSAPSGFGWLVLAGWTSLGLVLLVGGHWWSAARREPAST
jgi:hypothetical protein